MVLSEHLPLQRFQALERYMFDGLQQHQRIQAPRAQIHLKERAQLHVQPPRCQSVSAAWMLPDS